jgi:hypothetical protein
MSSEDWDSAFLAVSAILGEPLEASLAALGPARSARAEGLAAVLRSSPRDVRAAAIARVVARVAIDLDAMRLR